MTKNTDYIWYASYGSNLLEDRFNCYIQGGKPNGSQRNYPGCRNKNLPIDKEETYISSELYFAKESQTWNNGGVCFISNNFGQSKETLARMYLITKEQFIDIVKQENRNSQELQIDFEKAVIDGGIVFKKDIWYGKILYLGNQNNYPIFTFTNEIDIEEKNKPNENYLKIIIEGIKETFPNFNEFDIENYLNSKQGILGNFTKSELLELIRE